MLSPFSNQRKERSRVSMGQGLQWVLWVAGPLIPQHLFWAVHCLGTCLHVDSLILDPSVVVSRCLASAWSLLFEYAPPWHHRCSGFCHSFPLPQSYPRQQWHQDHSQLWTYRIPSCSELELVSRASRGSFFLTLCPLPLRLGINSLCIPSWSTIQHT